jgi:hypothetical protein
LPFGKGKRFACRFKGWANGVVSRWSVNSIVQQSFNTEAGEVFRALGVTA